MGIGVVALQTSQKRDLTSATLGPYFAPGAGVDPSFIVIASGIPYPTNAFVHGQPITWAFLDQATNHGSSFYTSVEGDIVTNRLKVNYPTVKTVLNTTITPDETVGAHGITVGSTSGLSSFTAPPVFTRTVGFRLTGDGLGNWTVSSKYSSTNDVSAYNVALGRTWFNVNTSTLGLDYDGIGIQYVGANNYGIQRVYSGLGPYNVSFVLLDRATGLPVASNPTVNDEILVTNCGTQAIQINCAFWENGNNDWMGTFTNFWVLGVYECWLVAGPISTSAISVRFQPTFPGATIYKVYRDTNAAFTAPTLVYTGTTGSFTDTGLLTNTLYYYKLVGTIAGVDTDITTFRTNTKSF